MGAPCREEDGRPGAGPWQGLGVEGARTFAALPGVPPRCPQGVAPPGSALLQTFGLRQSDLAALVLSSADATFLPDDEKAALKERLRAAMPPCNDPPVEETSRSFDVHRSFDVQRSQEARGPRAASFDVRGQASTEVRRRGRASFSFDVRRTGPAVPTPDPVDSLGPARTLDPLLEVEPPPQPESPAGDRKAPPKGRLSGGRQWFPWRKSSDSGQRVPS